MTHDGGENGRHESKRARFDSPDFIGADHAWDIVDPDEPRHPIANAIGDFLGEITSLHDSLPLLRDPIESLRTRGQEQYASLREALAREPEDARTVEVTARHAMPLSKQTRYLKARRAYDSGRHAGRNLYGYCLIGLVSHYDAFLGRLLRALFEIRPALKKGMQSPLSAGELLDCDSLETAHDLLVEKEVEGVLHLSHVQQLQWLEHRLGIRTLREFESFPDFVEITERRNLVAHNGSLVNRRYIAACGAVSAPRGKGLTLGSEVVVDSEYLKLAYDRLFEVGVKLAQVCWRKVRSRELELADFNLTRICYHLLLFEQFPLAQTLLEFAVALPKHSSGLDRKIFIINLAQSHKWQGDQAACSAILGKEDWSDAEPTFNFARSVLENDFAEAGRILRAIAPGGEIVGRRALHDWPLLREFRETDEFANAYEEVYGSPFVP